MYLVISLLSELGPFDHKERGIESNSSTANQGHVSLNRIVLAFKIKAYRDSRAKIKDQ